MNSCAKTLHVFELDSIIVRSYSYSGGFRFESVKLRRLFERLSKPGFCYSDRQIVPYPVVSKDGSGI